MSELTEFKSQLLNCVANIEHGLCPKDKVDSCNNTLVKNCYVCWFDDLLVQKSESGLHLAIVKSREDLTGCKRVDECPYPYDDGHVCETCEDREWFAEEIKDGE